MAKKSQKSDSSLLAKYGLVKNANFNTAVKKAAGTSAKKTQPKKK